jgi:GR25 family glycosyltransferase involved in LPS biosynthesis
MNEYIKQTFRNNDFNYRQGYIGCALSHIELWKELSKSDEDYYIIMEDDIEFADNFESKLNLVLHSLTNNPYVDISFLGYFYWNGKPEKRDEYPIVKMIEIPKYMGGTIGYIISKAGACKLLNIVKYKGVQNGIDRFMHIHFNKMIVTNCEPHIIFSDYATNNNTNMQHGSLNVRLPATDLSSATSSWHPSFIHIHTPCGVLSRCTQLEGVFCWPLAARSHARTHTPLARRLQLLRAACTHPPPSRLAALVSHRDGMLCACMRARGAPTWCVHALPSTAAAAPHMT